MTESQKIFGMVMKETSGIIIGYEEIIEDFLICLSAGGHILLEGVPGISKTTLAKTMSEIVGMKFKRIQFTQDLLPADITGHYFFNQKEQDFLFREGPIFANVVLADEINRAPSKTQSALLEAMEENQVTVEGTTFKLEEPFMVIATINPVEHEGVYSLPEAQLDRFMMKSKMEYLTPERELNLLRLKNRGWKDQTFNVIKGNIFAMMRKEIKACRADDTILTYVRDLVLETRNDSNVVLGASPRAAEQLVYASKGSAILSGRTYTIPDDVKKVFRKMIPHRLGMSLDSELEGKTAENVVEDILAKVPVVSARPVARPVQRTVSG
ncbi:MAG: MoxR family ATPase [Candidatus Thermoplasmatota archaeon]|nr:MoxR family ATPase [Candidatus Thermoplasmatota archaeon]